MTVVPTELPASLVATLPGSSYVDPAVFAREQELIFERMWFCAVRAADLAGPGAFRTVQIGRESILVTRGRDGAGRGSASRSRGSSGGRSGARTTPGPTTSTGGSSPRPT